jgi:hypothetical protein
VSKIEKDMKVGKIEYLKFGPLVRFTEEQVEKYIENHVVKFVGTIHSPGRLPAHTDEIAPTENTSTYVSRRNGTKQ